MKRKHMTRIQIVVNSIIAVAIVATGYAAADVVSNKYDGDCPASATAGRCADKCPDGSYLLVYGKDDGQPVCKMNPTGCPYGDSVPLGPECDKLTPAPTDTETPPLVSDTPVPAVYPLGGK